MNGGYYAVDLSDDVILITLNGMYPFFENNYGLADVAE